MKSTNENVSLAALSTVPSAQTSVGAQAASHSALIRMPCSHGRRRGPAHSAISRARIRFTMPPRAEEEIQIRGYTAHHR